jgi:hypothetical protein
MIFLSLWNDFELVDVSIHICFKCGWVRLHTVSWLIIVIILGHILSEAEDEQGQEPWQTVQYSRKQCIYTVHLRCSTMLPTRFFAGLSYDARHTASHRVLHPCILLCRGRDHIFIFDEINSLRPKNPSIYVHSSSVWITSINWFTLMYESTLGNSTENMGF